MSKNIVICCDGTGNEISTHLSNVLKLYRMVEEHDTQIRYYDPGIGTMGDKGRWSKYWSSCKKYFGLATGVGLDENILDAYSFLINNYEEGDKIYMFGFSRGAYTVTAIAGLLYQIGLLRPEQINLSQYALKAYRSVPFGKHKNVDNKTAWRFSRITNARRVNIHFMGLWDPVSSILAPRSDVPVIVTLHNLPFTSENPAVKNVRLAASIDEKRRMFRLHGWVPDQIYKPNPFDENAPAEKQNFEKLWFAGVHSDVGGGYPENESAIAKYPLEWMVNEATELGLEVNRPFFKRLVLGESREGSTREYVAANHLGMIHDSMRGLWKLLEYFPKRTKWLKWPDKTSFLGWYLPLKEPRLIPKEDNYHHSVEKRIQEDANYNPVNVGIEKKPMD